MNSLTTSPRVFRTRALFYLVVVVAIISRTWFIRADLPFVYDADESLFVESAVTMLRNQDPNPHWFGAPASPTIYLLAGAYGGIYGVGRATGYFDSPDDFRRLYRSDPTLMYLSGRLITALFGVGAVILTYFIGRRVGSDWCALLAALLVALNVDHVTYSQLIRMDATMVFFVLLSFWYCLDILDNGSWRSYVLAGCALGLAVMSKYPAVAFAPVIALSSVLTKGPQRVIRLIAAAAASVVAAFLAAPFVFLDFGTVYRNVVHEARPEHLSATGEGFLSNLGRYATGPFVDAVGIGGICVLTLWLLSTPWWRDARVALFMTAIATFAGFLSSLNLWWGRWFLPIVPFVAILTALAAVQLQHTVRRRLGLPGAAIASAVLAVMLLAPRASGAWMLAGEMNGHDTRTHARTWILNNLPRDSTVLVEAYGPHLPYGSFRLYGVVGGDNLSAPSNDTKATVAEQRGERTLEPNFYPDGVLGQLRDVEEIRQHRIQYVVLSHVHTLYLAERSRYPEIVERYQQIEAAGKPIWTVEAARGKSRGPAIRILRMEQ